MNKKIIGLLIIILIILCAVGVGAYYFLAPQYKEFTDTNIQLEIPADVNFTVNNTTDEFMNNTLYYDNDELGEPEISMFDYFGMIFSQNNEIFIDAPLTSIELISINSNQDFSKEAYTTLKKNYFDEMSMTYTLVNKSKHNYAGEIYNVTDMPGNPGIYYIQIFDDEHMKFVSLMSTDLDVVIHMAETFKFK